MSKSWEWVWVNPNEAVRRISELERDLAWYKAECERLEDRNETLECENARLQMELDASWNAEELRQVRAELAALQEASQKKIL